MALMLYQILDNVEFEMYIFLLIILHDWSAANELFNAF